MCNLNIPDFFSEVVCCRRGADIVVRKKIFSDIDQSNNTPHFSSILRFTNIINSLNFNIWCTNSTGRESTTYEPKL